ncbi:hypothetical protein D9615_008225 [Tricholomella constricta]|uniref:HNH nuclease domain-containing protein n=1 Tax=Tricholomella constricta TaxID=117010 RepID=A0A8H5H3D0_9AGAR|nr:hypothetical protein D9615_008225 [Tricholomella constricta]
MLATPPLTLFDHRDIKIYDGPIAYSANPLYCSSLEGQREVKDVFAILDTVVVVRSSNNFVLREINDSGTFLDTVYERGAPGTFKPGRYIIVPQEDGEEVFRRRAITFASAMVEAPLPEKAMDDGPRGFKMRLADNGMFILKFLWPIQLNIILLKWALRGYQNLIQDPYTATSAENATRNEEDPLRLNSLENGILFCLLHHKAYDTLRFSIHPETHKIFAFHPAIAHLHGLQVASPWKALNSLYPSPHKELLEAHFQTSIFTSLSAAAEPSDDDDDDDELEFPEIPSNHDNEAVRIWAEDPDRYPPAEWRLDDEEWDTSTAGVPDPRDVEIHPSDF